MVNHCKVHAILLDAEYQSRENNLLYFFITTFWEAFIKFEMIFNPLKTIKVLSILSDFSFQGLKGCYFLPLKLCSGFLCILLSQLFHPYNDVKKKLFINSNYL